jgi:DNA-binding transcriptional MerR regulator
MQTTVSTPTESGYKTLEVLKVVPVTARQLQWWDEQGILSPRQHGHSRVYQQADVFGVMLIHELKQRGFTLQQIRKVRRELRKQDFAMPTEQQRWLLTNGERVVLLAHENVVIAFLEQRRSPAFVLLSLAAMAKKLAAGEVQLHRLPLKREPQREVSPVQDRLERRA